MAKKRAAMIFPGQGSQRVGMGRAWADAFPASRAAFAAVDRALDLPLGTLCWEGPAEILQLTVNTQPAILATSIAILRGLAAAGWLARLRPVAVAGHSLGEYSALVAVDSLALEDAARLVRRRGELMQDAVPLGEGAMAAVIGLPAEEVVAAVAAVAAEATAEAPAQVCVVANYNAPEQTVIAGHRPAVERALAVLRERGAKRAMLLPVSAPFHSPLMAPARRGLQPLLARTRFGDPATPVVTNVDAAPVADGAAARDALERQVDGPVRWVESVRRMRSELAAEVFIEVGPGNVLTGLIRRILPDAAALSLAEPEALQELESLLG